jgi:hypothetical protein
MILNSKLSKNNIDKNLILIRYLETIIKGYLIKSEISSNDIDTKVIVVQMTTGERELMYDDYLYDNFNIQVFGKSIREQKQTAYEISLLARTKYNL